MSEFKHAINSSFYRNKRLRKTIYWSKPKIENPQLEEGEEEISKITDKQSEDNISD